MTPEQKIITIAEFEGWKQISSGQWCKDIKEGVTWSLPTYLTSRDAICGVVARLDDEQFCEFIENLEAVTGCHGDQITGVAYKRGMLLATPAQLADALLLTLGHEI